MILPPDPGAHLASVATALPPHRLDRDAAVRALRALYPDEEPAFLERLVERSGVEHRHLVPSLDEILAQPDFTRRNRRWSEAAVDLAERACRDALARAELAPDEVDCLIDVSCTGIAIPALDVALVPRLGLRHDVRRVPIAESGCAGGAVALGLAAPLAQAGMRVLVVAVELCSLALCAGDRSRASLVSSVLFGDGAAAAVLAPGGPGPRIEAVGTHLVPGTADAMGFDVGAHGLRILLRRELPEMLGGALVGAVEGFLHAHGRAREDVGLHLVHPGGRRILDAYEELFALERGGLRWSREALRRTGNLSSASVLVVLELALAGGASVPPGREALLVGVGPGLSLELALLGWEAPSRRAAS